jgi:hypothetical protein
MAGEELTREQAARRIGQIREGERAYWDRARYPAEHAALVQEMNELQAIALAPVEVSEEERSAREASVAARKKIADLKADPAYFDGSKDPAKHAELVKQVGELAPVAYRGEE